MAADWAKVRNEYITGAISYRQLAKKNDVSFNTLKERAVKENWVAQKKEFNHKTAIVIQRKASERILKNEISRIDRLFELSDKLNDKIEEAIDELNIIIVTNREKVREVEYKDADAKGRISRETVVDEESASEVVTIVDRQGLLQVANALKAVKEIQTTLNDRVEENAEVEDDGFVEAMESATMEAWKGEHETD